MEWKIFSIERKWNGRKLPVWNLENRLPFCFIPWPVYKPDSTMWGSFRGRAPPNHCLRSPNREMSPQASIVRQKKVTGTMPMQCILESMPPKCE